MRIVAGRWRGRTIQPPPDHRTRPTADRVREAWLSALQFDLPGARVLDLFAGSGALGLEALSRGAAHVTFVENAPATLRTLRTNVQGLGAGADEYEIVAGDALAYARGLAAHAFDLAFADPPYASGHGEALARLYATTPFADILSIEHASGTAPAGLPGARTRVYGDTAITFLTADP
jgi:16S rRNA (guanine966-N2)-methyltransferase